MDYLLKFNAELGVFVFKGVETVGALGDYFFYLVFFKNFPVGFNHAELKKTFFAEPPCRVSATHLFLAQNRVIDPRSVQDIDDRMCYFLIPHIIRSEAPYPIEVFEFLLFRCHRYVESLHPHAPVILRKAPGISRIH